jgi:hypothetical protein
MINTKTLDFANFEAYEEYCRELREEYWMSPSGLWEYESMHIAYADHISQIESVFENEMMDRLIKMATSIVSASIALRALALFGGDVELVVTKKGKKNKSKKGRKGKKKGLKRA